MNTKIAHKALRSMPTDAIVDMLRDLDPEASVYWILNRELTRREWFWLESPDAGE